MRIGEGLLIFGNGFLLIQALIQRPRISRYLARWISDIGVVITVLHLIIEGYRWQMLPVYVLIGAVMLPLTGNTTHRQHLPKKLAIAGLVILSVGIALLVILPVPRLPRPSGPYDIGTVTYEWVDTSRREIYGDTPGNPRRIMVQIWYPADKPRAALRQPWLESKEIARAMARRDHLPAFLIEQVKLTRTHTYADADIIQGTFQSPVIIYIHGWAGFRNINQDQIEALVSNGYVVISADHTYGALITLFPDGDVALNDSRALNGDGTAEGKDNASVLLVHTFAQDVSFILDKVTELNANDPDSRFTGRLDMDAVGVFGHSTGGGGAVKVCVDDERCKAVLGMDTWIEPVEDQIIEDGLTQPFMVLNSESWKRGPNRERLQHLFHATHSERYWLDIPGTKHYDFVLVPTFSPLAHLLGFSGSLPAKDILLINETYLVAFFDRHLRNLDMPWLSEEPLGIGAVELEYQPQYND